MHIGLFSPAWPPGQIANGIVTYVRIVREELLSTGHRVSVFTGTGEPDTAAGIHRVRRPQQHRIWQAARRLGRIGSLPPYDFGQYIAQSVAQVHSVEPIDVLEMEESFGWCGDVARTLRLPVVVRLHGPAFLSLIDGEQHTPARLERIRREGEGLRAARLVVAPSASTLNDTATKYAFGPIGLACVPNPVDDVDDELVWRLDRRQPGHVLFVGRFDFRKGGDAAIRAFVQLAVKRPSLQLTFVGPDVGLPLQDGEVQYIADYLRAHVSQDIATRIHFLGSRPASEIRALRARCALSVVATRWESFGYVVAEAMMQGCPIAAFDVSGVNELVAHGRTGLLAPLDDVPALASAMTRLLDHPIEAAELGARARQSVVDQCGAPAVVARLIDLYRQLRAT